MKDRAAKITAIAQIQPGFVRAGVGMEHEAGFWGNVFEVEGGWLSVVFTNETTYKAFEKILVAAMPDDAEVKRQTKPVDPSKFSWNKKRSWKTEQERIIAENHAADIQNGLSQSDAFASDAFERRVLGLD